MSINVESSYIRRKDMDTVLSCLVTDSIGPGEYLGRFQKIVKETFGLEHVVALRSPIDALSLVFQCFALGPGDKVAVSSLSPSYYRTAALRAGLELAMVDVASDDCVPGPEGFQEGAPGAKALIVHEPYGILPEFAGIRAMGLPVVEDITFSFGAASGQDRAGELGSYLLFSLEDGGVLTAGGGALLGARGKREATVLRNAGDALDPELLLTDMNAALGLAQFKEMRRSIEKRKDLHAILSQAVARSPHALAVRGEELAYSGFPVFLKGNVKDVVAYAKKKDIETKLAFERSLLARDESLKEAYPNAYSTLLRCIAFPLHPRIGATDAQRLAKVLATLP